MGRNGVLLRQKSIYSVFRFQFLHITYALWDTVMGD